jgi:thiol:disulfide interchange protein
MLMRQETPPPASAVLDVALKEARKSNRGVFVHFSASWCGWCKLLEKGLQSPEVKPIFEAHYVPVKLIVLESGKNKALENPGADRFLAENGGANRGIPFMVFLDKNGKKVADSNVVGPKKDNIGCPASKEEIAAFGDLLKKTAPRLSDADRAKILDYFTRNAPKG